jgi:hypothetical protein
MLRTLIVLAALALSGCASYGPSYRDERAPVYRDGSYYSPSASGYGDYYYAPEYRYYDSYYDDYGYGWGYPYGYGYGASHFCSFRYRPCGYGSYWGPGFGLSLFFGRGWSRWNDPWYSWPYYGGWYGGWQRDWDRDRDWNRNHDHDRPRQPNPPYTGGDRNRLRPPGAGAGWPNPGNTRPPRTDRPIEIRDPYPVRDRNRNPGYRDERGYVPMPMPRDRNQAPVPRDRNVVVMPREPGAPPPTDRNRGGWQVAPPPPRDRSVVVMPRDPSTPPPADRNRGGWQVEPPAPRAPPPRNDNDNDRSPPPPARRERSGDMREDVRRDGEHRPALQ